MVVYYHNYKNKEQVTSTGASLFYSEITKILAKKKEKHIQFIPFQFKDLLKGKLNFYNLTHKDIVMCNCGPFAWALHYLREKNSWKFRIIRDIQTSLYATYIFQEQLCSWLTREGDQIIFPSEYCRQLFIKLFPGSINFNNSFICYPMLELSKNQRRRRQRSGNTLVLGWVGRVDDDKNFMQAVEIFCNVALKKKSSRVQMLVLGPLIKEKFNEQNIKKYIEKHKCNPNNYHHIGRGKFMPSNIKFNAWRQIDVFLFPSMANHESLGRTLLEANYFSIPILAANHGAVSSLVPKMNLLEPIYYNKKFDLKRVESLGEIDINKAADMIVNNELEIKRIPKVYEDHDKKLINIILNNFVDKKQRLDAEVNKFITKAQIFTQLSPDVKLRSLCEKLFRLLKNEPIINLTNTTHKLMADCGYEIYAKIK